MKMLILVGIVALGCGCPRTTMINPRECHDMCYPRQVEKFSNDGCFCSDGLPPKPQTPPEPEK